MFLRGKFDKSIGQFSVKPMASSSEWFSEGGLPGNIDWNYIVWKYRHPPLNPSVRHIIFLNGLRQWPSDHFPLWVADPDLAIRSGAFCPVLTRHCEVDFPATFDEFFGC